jgi:SAM-dependent methyltransferase
MIDTSLLRCLLHDPPLPLHLSDDSLRLLCPAGHATPIVNGIPRFVPDESYASAFGAQWKKFRQTQLDSYTGVPLSAVRLAHVAGGSLDIFKGKLVLEAGCGAGRFTEVLLKAGATVQAVDISKAVEANYETCHQYPAYRVCQADILKVPVEPGQFEAVVCVGVIQHTPSPEAIISALCGYLAPGGLLVIDHYADQGKKYSFIRRLPRMILLRLPAWLSLLICHIITAVLWPLHRLLWTLSRQSGERGFFRQARDFLLKVSPVIDYHDRYPDLNPEHLYAWAILDLHDATTAVYRHLRTEDQIIAHLRSCGMVEIETEYVGYGIIEARARKPAG